VPVWDTSVASGLRPEGALFNAAAAAALAGEPIRLAAPTVAEISYGLQRRSDEEAFANALSWFAEVLRAGLLEVLPVSREAALLFGRLRALHPSPPASRRGDGQSKPERRVAWVTDIQIAACVWLHGDALCTADHSHFRLLGEGIATLFPGEGALEILPVP
jgi:predicted nucleic acid-binding protein